MSDSGVVVGEDGVARCAWGDSTADYRPYHDTEWGFPVDADVRLFEKLSLEGFQAGLSWLTILRKREAFRAGFAGFDFRVVASFGSKDVERLLQDAGENAPVRCIKCFAVVRFPSGDPAPSCSSCGARLSGSPGIVRHRGKIEAVINNAGRAVEMVAAEGSIAHFVWSYAPARRSAPFARFGDVPAATEFSTAMSKELKRRGWKFVGPTTMYAFMQSMGIVNDHLAGCDAHAACAAARDTFTVP